MAVHSAIKNSIEKAFAGLIDNLVAETSTENNRLWYTMLSWMLYDLHARHLFYCTRKSKTFTHKVHEIHVKYT